MARTPHTLALCALLSSTPLLSVGLAAAEPAGSPERAAPAAPADMQRMNRTAPDPSGSTPAAGSSDLAAPATPVPMNLPDEATQNEVTGQRGVGIATLVLGAAFVVAIVLGGLYFFSRRSWSTQH